MNQQTGLRLISLSGFWALVALLTWFASQGAQAQDIDKLFVAVKQAAEKRQAAGQTAKITWSQRETIFKGSLSRRLPPPFTPAGDTQPPQDATHEGSGGLLLNADQARISRTAVVWHFSLRRFHNDQTESLIKGKQYSRLIHYGSQEWPQGRLSKDGWQNEAEVVIWPMLMALRGADEQIVNAAGIASYSSARRVTVDGQPCVELTRQRTEYTGERKLVLSESPGYPLKRMDIFDPQGILEIRTTIIADRTVDGLAYPSEWTISSYYDKKIEYTVSVKTGQFDLHPKFTGEDFSLNFPVGAYVVDTQGEAMKEYIVRPDGTNRVVLPEERGAGYQALVNSETGDLARPLSGRQRSLPFVTVVGGALVLLAVLLLVVRSRRRPSGPSEQPH